MIKSEISEVKKQFNHKNCSITKVSGCYVDGEKNIKTKFTESFLTLPEEETFKYFEIFKKTLSGRLGKNLINMEFPISEEFNEGKQEFLLKLRDSELKDEMLLDEFYDKIIENYDFVGNYLILILYASYDIPGKTRDNIIMEDASDEVYNYILCSTCPVKLSKPGLSYNADTNMIQNRIQDWVVGMPENGFLFPAFHDRSTDIHSILYYSRNSEEFHDDYVSQLFGCKIPLSAGSQKEIFHSLITETLGEDCDYNIIKNIHENVNDLIEENKDNPEPIMVSKAEVKHIFRESGIDEEKLQEFDKKYETVTGKDTSLDDSQDESENGSLDISFDATNIVNTRTFEVKTPDIVIKVNPERTDLVETKMVDGRKCLVIEISDQVEVNGIPVKALSTP